MDEAENMEPRWKDVRAEEGWDSNQGENPDGDDEKLTLRSIEVVRGALQGTTTTYSLER